MVQVALLPARVLVPQLSAESVKSPGLVPASTGAEHPVAVAVPELVKVKVCVAEVVVVLIDPKFWVKGDQAKFGEIPVTVIWLAVVVIVPPSVQVLLSVAVLAPTTVGAALTAMVQVALPPARVLVPQLSLESVNSLGLVPASTGAEHPVAVAVPELVRVKVWDAEVAPVLIDPKFWVKGVHAKFGETPVTVIWLAVVVTVPPSMQVRLRVVVLAPMTVGAALTAMVQVAPPLARSLVPQVSPDNVNSLGLVPASTGAEHPVALALPELVRVKVWDAEVAPVLIDPKFWVKGSQARLIFVPVTVIWSAVVVTVPPTVQDRISVVVLFPVVVGSAATLIVQVALAPRSLVEQVSPERTKSPALAPPSVGAVHPVAAKFPVLARIKAWVAEVVLTVTNPKLFVNGLQFKPGEVPTTVIWSAVVVTLPEVPDTVQVLLKVVVLVPLLVGWAATRTVQDLPAPRFAVPQLSVWIVNSVGLVPANLGAEQLVAIPVPELVKVKVWVAEVVPTLTEL
jgi:hypothetical protein